MPNGLKASALITIDASKADATALANLEQILYGTAGEMQYVATTDATKQAGKTYYTRSGTGTSEDPYTYTEFTDSTFEQGTTYYEYKLIGAVDPYLPLPEEVYEIFNGNG